MWGLITELNSQGKYESPKLKKNKNENANVMVGTLGKVIKVKKSQNLIMAMTPFWHHFHNLAPVWGVRKPEKILKTEIHCSE